MRRAAVAALCVALVLGPTAGTGATDADAHHTVRSWQKRYVEIPTWGRRWLRRLGNCETLGIPYLRSWRAHSPSGLYHGRYQFDRRTWGTVGGRGDPHRASRWEQSVRAW